MKTTKGDLIKLAIEGEFDVIIHGCNCFNTMGAGIAKAIKINFPEAYNEDLKTIKGSKDKLGTITWAETTSSTGRLIVVNAYTQFNWRENGIKADYDAIRKAFKNIKANFGGLRMGYPAIGAGLAGGDWQVISNIINEELIGEDHTFVEFKK